MKNKMKAEDVKNCMFSSWHPLFKSVTIQSKILKIPDSFLEYLHADGIVLPDGVEKGEKNSAESKTSEDSDTEWDSPGTTDDSPDFGEFDTEIRAAIKSLGGAVFPKLNWSSPKDAVWITSDSTLRCTSPSDICLLLKSSDFVAHDLSEPYDRCEDVLCESDIPHTGYTLVLRRWKQLHPAGEFRCFVKKKQLVGISQRHASNYYPFISDDEESIIEDIKQLFNSLIKERFMSHNYVFDVYRKEKGKVSIIDFNPFGTITDGLLFTWQELFDMDVESGISLNPIFRFIKTEAGVQPNPYSSYTMPVDFVHLSTGEDPHKLMDFLKLKTLSQTEEDSPEDDEGASTSNTLPKECDTEDSTRGQNETDTVEVRQEITQQVLI